MRFTGCSFGAAWAVCLVASSCAYDPRDNPPPISISSLLVETKIAPIGIDVTPRFSWVVTSSERGVSQEAYRLAISAITPGAAEMWDSGIVSSSLPYLVEYAGPTLQSDTRYFWTVDVTTNIGAASSSSNFTTGFLSQDAWSPSLWIGKNTSVIPNALSAAFAAASWIWTPESDPTNSPPGDRAFRRVYTSPPGKTAKTVIIVMTVDDGFTLYVDGAEVGASPSVADVWKSAQIVHAVLNSTDNLFAVRATNLATGPAGLIAAIQITFDDGSTDIIASDSGWRATASIPTDFQSPALDDSAWPLASSLGQYGVSPWDTQVTIAAPAAITPSLTNSDWIWAAEPNQPIAPPGDVAFRRTAVSPPGKTAESAVIIITADDNFTLYVNGVLVGRAPNEPSAWEVAPLYRVLLNSDANLFAVRATNAGTDDNPAGLIAAISILYSDGSTDFVASDMTWKVATTIPPRFQFSSTDDTAWATAASLGAYGVAPWGTGLIISDALGEHPAPLLRKSFSIAKRVSYARLYYSADGFASISLNGVLASDRVLSPGFTKYDTQVQYVGLDVTPLLFQGENAIALELGRSYYGITQPAESQWNWVAAAWHGEPVFRGVLSIGYADGTTERLVSDGSWKVIEGPTRLDDIYGGENYDASFIIPGYDSPGFDDSAWDYAQVSSGPAGMLVNARQPPTRLVESLRPTSISQPVPGIYVAAFERVVAGWAKITATGPAKTLIIVHFGEVLDPDGTVVYLDLAHNFANNWQTDRFWLAGTGGAETFEPKFSYKGYQYVQIEGWPGTSPPTPEDIIGQVVHDDLGMRGDFASSSDLFNQLHASVRYTMLNNVHSFPTDCPTFEKKGWSGDAMLATEMFLANFDSAELLAKYVRDLHETRVQGEGPPDVIGPDSGFGWNTQAPPWHSALILTPAWIYEYRGDERVLSDHYPSMKSYIAFELQRSPGNIASTWLADWNSPETPALGGNPPEDPRVSATAFLYHMLTTMVDIALVLGHADDAASFGEEASAVKAAFNAAFFNATAGYYTGVADNGYRQSHNILAVAFNLTPDNETAAAVASSIISDVAQRDMHLNTGALSTKHLLPLLTTYGHTETALALAQQTTYPSWGFWIENNATSMWENWGLDARSRDHFFLGTFEDWFFKDVLGIQSTGVAFQTVDIRPVQTDRLTSARGWMLTPFGNISVAWMRDSGSLNLSVGIPVGITATVSFTSTSEVTEGGVDISTKDVFTVLAGEPKRVVMGSGEYAFVASVPV
ncbi:bacterial alpha-L-rhamnosidase-domain-containing protein [Mycena rosella]|uniref:alpha-L-rhamnosidase n=1 Tax=Mycena rosella TaxID=1033263 RepID=A0AAD7GRL3_MYCRO|nr:bacterial alpha-L-rhamnosidase-domain-containing protein [Mycena rosella]